MESGRLDPNFVIPDLIRDPRRRRGYGSRIKSGMTIRGQGPLPAGKPTSVRRMQGIGGNGNGVARYIYRAQTKWGPTSLPTPTIRSRPPHRRPASSRSASLAIGGPQNDALRRAPERSGDGLVGPLSGPGLTWKTLHHLIRASAEASALLKRWTAFQLSDLVRFNSWESLRSVIRLPADFLVQPTRSLLASLATTLHVPAVRRLCRPMI